MLAPLMMWWLLSRPRYVRYGGAWVLATRYVRVDGQWALVQPPV